MSHCCNNATLHFYTSNVSLEKKWFVDDRYSTAFNNYGLEDIELGYRLEKKGLRIVYHRDAVVCHVHYYNLDSFSKRMYNVGGSAVIFRSLHPEMGRKLIPIGWRIILFFSTLLSYQFIGWRRLYWYAKIVSYYFRGVSDGLAKEKREEKYHGEVKE